MFFEAHMFMNVNVKKKDYKGLSQMLATPGEGARSGVRDGLSSFSLHILASWSLFQENVFMYDFDIFTKIEGNK